MIFNTTDNRTKFDRLKRSTSNISVPFNAGRRTGFKATASASDIRMEDWISNKIAAGNIDIQETVQHFGFLAVDGTNGDAFIDVGSSTPVLPNGDSPGEITGYVTSEYTVTGSSLNYIGAAAELEIGATLSFKSSAAGDYLISIFKENVEVAATEVRVTTVVNGYVTVVLPTVPVEAETNDSFVIKLVKTAGSAIVDVHRYTIYSRKIQ